MPSLDEQLYFTPAAHLLSDDYRFADHLREMGLMPKGPPMTRLVVGALLFATACSPQDRLPSVMAPGDVFVSAYGEVQIYGRYPRLCTELEKLDEQRLPSTRRVCDSPAVLMVTIHGDQVSVEPQFTVNEALRQMAQWVAARAKQSQNGELARPPR